MSNKKAVSVYIGPTGVALIGQFQNSTQLAMNLAKGGINSGVTKYTAEFNANDQETASLWATALRVTLFSTAIVGLILILGSEYFSFKVMKSYEFSFLFITFGITLIFFTLNQLLLSILNGLKEIKTFVSINITQSLYSLVYTTALILIFGLKGALFALVTNQAFVFFTIIFKLRKHKAFSLEKLGVSIDKVILKKLLSYSAMALTTALCVPLSQLFIRNHIGENISWESAGYWQSMWYISTMYLMVITTALTTYYLPKLSELKSVNELRDELLKGYTTVTPIVVIMTLIVFLLREFIVWLLFTSDFYPMLELFKWQLVGDFFRIMSLLLSYLMLAKAMTKIFIVTEILFSASYVVLSVFLVDKYQLVGVTYAYSINYLLYFISMIFIMKSTVFKSCKILVK